MNPRPRTWTDVDSVLQGSLESSWKNGVPPMSTAVHARWWQLETWLRSLANVELRSDRGSRWTEALTESASKREKADEQQRYMASPDAKSRLAYLDFLKLCDVVEDNWLVFEKSLIEHRAWAGRIEELRSVRNRLAHCRRPHLDDLNRVEQMLRDLERGAFDALAAYSSRYEPDPALDDPLVADWIRLEHEDASLVGHAERTYDVHFHLQSSSRPWAASAELVSGSRGYLWHAVYYLGQRHLPDPRRLWNHSYLDPMKDQDLLVDIALEPYSVTATFAAVDSPSAVADAIGKCFEAVLQTSRAGLQRTDLDLPMQEALRADDVWASQGAGLDSRVHLNSPWGTIDETTVPVTIFGSGSGVE